MAARYMSQQTDMFLSGRFWVVLASKCRLLVNETWPKLLPFTLCPLYQCLESAHLFWNIGSSRKIPNYMYMYCQKKIPKQQGHLMTCNVGANKYWVHVWFSNWLYNVQYCARFWICSCLYGNNSDVAFDE